MSVEGNQQAESVLRFIDVKDALVTAPRLQTPARAFLQLEGAENARITIDGGDVSRAMRTLALENGAQQAAVKVRA